MFIDQLLTEKQNRIRDWRLIQLYQFKKGGPEPVWYKSICTTLTIDNKYLINPQCLANSCSSPPPLNKLTLDMDGRRKVWGITRDLNDNVIFGKFKIAPNQARITFYHYNASAYSDHQTILTKCNGCSFHNLTSATDPCSRKTRNNAVWLLSFLNHVKQARRQDRYILNEKYTTLIREIATNTFTLPTSHHNLLPTLHIDPLEITLIKTHIADKYSQQKLSTLYYQIGQCLNSHKELTFYSDGSMSKDIKRQQTRMGAAWIMVQDQQITHSFQTGVQDWPSALRAELVAIITIVLALPANQKITVHTDCKGIITKFQSLSRENPRMTHKRWLKQDNWLLWTRLIELVKTKEILITYIKAKAHSEDPFNNIADQQAKTARKERCIQWQPLELSRLPTTPKWQQCPIETPIRHFLKYANKKKEIVKWTQQNHIKNTWQSHIDQDQNYTWDSVWHLCNKSHSWKTSFKLTKKRSFLVKLINDELPTLETLNIWDPDNYPDPTCKLCKDKEETRTHLFECAASLPNIEEA